VPFDQYLIDLVLCMLWRTVVQDEWRWSEWGS